MNSHLFIQRLGVETLRTTLPTMREIAWVVAEIHGLTLSDLLGRSQAHRIAHPRQEAMALIHAEGRFSLPQIGRFFGRDHSTIHFGVARHWARLETASAARAA